MIRARVTSTLLMLSIGAGSVSRAQDANSEPVRLSWVTPENSGCPDAEYVLAEIRRYVGPRAAEHRSISASATIRPSDAGGFQLILKTAVGPTSGERAFEDESCRALADAAVVILAWMVAPDAVASGALPTRSREARFAPVLTPPPSPPKVVGPTPYLGLGATPDIGTLPDPALGVEVRAGISFGQFRLEARAAYWPTRRKSVAALPSGEVPGATFTLGSASLHGCLDAFPPSSTSRWGLALCLGPEVDLLNGAGFGVTVPAKATRTWVSLSAGIEGRVAIVGPVSVLLALTSVLPAARDHFALRGVGEIYRPTPVAGRGTLGFELDL